jgi:hypothetical protein
MSICFLQVTKNAWHFQSEAMRRVTSVYANPTCSLRGHILSLHGKRIGIYTTQIENQGGG